MNILSKKLSHTNYLYQTTLVLQSSDKCFVPSNILVFLIEIT